MGKCSSWFRFLVNLLVYLNTKIDTLKLLNNIISHTFMFQKPTRTSTPWAVNTEAVVMENLGLLKTQDVKTQTYAE